MRIGQQHNPHITKWEITINRAILSTMVVTVTTTEILARADTTHQDKTIMGPEDHHKINLKHTGDATMVMILVRNIIRINNKDHNTVNSRDRSTHNETNNREQKLKWWR